MHGRPKHNTLPQNMTSLQLESTSIAVGVVYTNKKHQSVETSPKAPVALGQFKVGEDEPAAMIEYLHLPPLLVCLRRLWGRSHNPGTAR